MSTDDDQRRFLRLPIRLEVQITDGATTIVSGNTRDISQEGLYVFTDKPLLRGTACQIVLLLSGPKSTLRFEVMGKVVRVDGAGMAVTFTELEMDSLFHLRNLVQYNIWLLGAGGQW